MTINFNKAEFVLSATTQNAFIRDGRPQVTFAGRSNVGKSSVINRLLNRKNFARVGATPGKTSQVNYFRIDGKLYFTDLPGYGYAKVSKEERERWGRLMESYFQEPGLISLGILIVDARHKPSADDVTMCDWFKEAGCPMLVVANKVDKLKKREVEPNLEIIRQTLELPPDTPLVPFSAEKGDGKTEVLSLLSHVFDGVCFVYLCPSRQGNIRTRSWNTGLVDGSGVQTVSVSVEIFIKYCMKRLYFS